MKIRLRLTAIALVFASGCVQPQRKRGTSAAIGKPLTISLSPGCEMEFVWIDSLGMWAGRHEVTVAQYRVFDPSKPNLPHSIVDSVDNDHPVLALSWRKSMKFCSWLTRRHRKVLPAGFAFRLPSEGEWEALARCGDDRKYPWGDKWPPQPMADGILPNGQGDDVDEPTTRLEIRVTWGRTGAEPGGGSRKREPTPRITPDYRDGWTRSCPSARSGANGWGLCGLAGNVAEWCGHDHSGKKVRLAKGGSWACAEPRDFLVTTQEDRPPRRAAPFVPFCKAHALDVGFRVVVGKRLSAN